jgi:TolB-like protein
MQRLARQVLAGLVVGLLIIISHTASAQDLRSGVEQLADQIIQVAPQDKTLRVAVIDFPDLLNVMSDLGRYIANRLTTRLAQSEKFFVVERQRLGQLLSELKFSMTDLVDPEKAKQLGQIVGVEAILVGTVSDLGNQVDVDARVIEIDTSRMLVSVATTISKDQVVTQLMGRGRTAIVFPSSSASQVDAVPIASTDLAPPTSAAEPSSADQSVTAYFKAYNAAGETGNLEGLLALWADDGEAMTPYHHQKGKDAIRAQLKTEMNRWVSPKYVEKKRIIEGNTAAWEGAWEAFPTASQRRVILPTVVMITINQEGKVQSTRMYYDWTRRLR